MKNILLTTALLIGSVIYGQFTLIPDANFEQGLIDIDVDSDGVVNGQLLTLDAEGTTIMYLPQKGIEDLTGIQDFINVEELTLTDNALTSIDFRQNTSLRILYLDSNSLEGLYLRNGANLLLTTLDIRDNAELVCVAVDDPAGATNGDFPYSGWLTDPGIIYSENCLLGIPDFQSSSISVYPNPSGSWIFIKSQTHPITKVEIYNVLGQRVETFDGEFKRADTSGWNSGIYLLKIYTQNGFAVKRIIKQ